MKLHQLFGSFVCVLACHVACAASDFSWTFQPTGFRSNSGYFPQTALSMRNNLSWPVVYGFDGNGLAAYSLFSVPNPAPVPIGPGSYWHQIGANITQTQLPSSVAFSYLQAASSPTGSFAVSVQTPFINGSTPDSSVIGSSVGGFQAPLNGVASIKFDANGNPFKASSTTVPIDLQPNKKIFDVALGKYGEVGAVAQSQGGSGLVLFAERNPLLGTAWSSVELPLGPYGEDMHGATIDLAYDSASRPHVIGISSPQYTDSVVASRFDVVTGDWVYSVLDSSSDYPIADVAAAANDAGIIGAAWVKAGVLKYAYLDTNDVSPTWTITSVATSTPSGERLVGAQGVGLAFDRSGLPVISFLEYGNQQIWIAYDPPVTAPIAGDFNHDGFVDGGDLDIWKTAFADATASADADGDGDSDGSDFLAWQRNFAPLGNAAAANAAVPEPLGLVSSLTAIVAIAAASRRPRHCLQL